MNSINLYIINIINYVIIAIIHNFFLLLHLNNCMINFILKQKKNFYLDNRD